jgi:VWFA-related protein
LEPWVDQIAFCWEGNRTVKGTIRKANRPGIVLGIILCALAALSFQDKPRELVTVTAVEVPVRVFDKNGFITGLGKDDFEVFENSIKQDITGFEAVSRAIAPVSVALPDAVLQAPRKRNFLLIFNVFDYTDQVGEAIDYFFKYVFHEDDRLIIVAEDRLLSVGTGKSVDSTVAGLKETLKSFKRISRNEILSTFNDLRKRANQAAAALGAEGDEDTEVSETPIKDFYEYYQQVWEKYRRRMLSVDMDLYRGIVGRMNNMDGDKWAICFQQRDLFPKLKYLGRLDRAMTDSFMQGLGISQEARINEVAKQKLEQSFDITKTFPADKLMALFTDANITFHVLIMKSLYQGGLSRDIELGDVNADYEDVLRKISRSTGGLTGFSNKVIDTLKQAAEKEDKYYLLVYQPKDKTARQEREIEVKVRRDGAEVVALKRFVGQKPPAITIAGFEVKDKQFSFDLKNGGRLEQGGRNTGKVKIKVTVFNGNSEKVFSEAKSFDLIADSIHMALNFEKLTSGDYFIIIEAADLVTGEKDVFSRAIIL